MKTPTLEEVKEYFKDAKEVKCVNFKNIKELIDGVYEEDSIGFLYESPNDYIRLYSHKNGYAEIITYKNNNIMKSDLSKVKVGDIIWTIQEGWTEVKTLRNGLINENYHLNGKRSGLNKHPSAFLTNPFEVVAKEYLVGNNDKTHSRKKGIVLNGIFYVESGWVEWAEIIQQPIELTLEERIARLENELKKIKK